MKTSKSIIDFRYSKTTRNNRTGPNNEYGGGPGRDFGGPADAF